MDINNKLTGFKSYLSENRLNNGGVKTTIDQSAVASTEQNNVDLNLNEDKKNGLDKKKKKKKQDLSFLEKNMNEEAPKKTDQEIKETTLKLLNSI